MATTLKQAQAAVPSYIQPSACFVVFKNSAVGWSPIEGTPCAHFVAHILGLRSKRTLGGYGCNAHFEIRVRALVAQLSPVTLEQVQVNDVWARLKGAKNDATGDEEPTDHCGIVIAVAKNADGTPAITIRHDSSGKHKVLSSPWSYFDNGGKFYRASTGAAFPPAVQSNLIRLKNELPLR